MTEKPYTISLNHSQNGMIIRDMAGRRLAEYKFAIDPKTGKLSPVADMVEMNKSIRAHLENGGELGNYPW